MDDIRNRLVKCFAAVFSSLSQEEIVSASPANVSTWDSVASVTLIATVEEEFGIEINVNKMAELLSYKNLDGYLREHASPSPH
jgi:acyl carrier protein